MGLNSQISFWDGNHPYKIKNKIRLIELFAGIGAQAKALERLQAEGLCEFEHYRICEFDKYAVKSYNSVHGTDFKPSDITKIHADDLGIVDTDSFTYLLTYSFPCTDLSIAGKQEGMAKGSGTRSGLLWEVERLLNECDELSQVLLMENVPQVICPDFFLWIEFLESKGYKNYYKNINAKDMGVPQNRLRTFMVSLLGDYYYEFPESIPLEKRLKDVLEDKVDEKYYLSDKAVKFFSENSQKQKENGNGFSFNPRERESRGCRSYNNKSRSKNG
jgi:DNA (cytosine-5)-methyltransferase 1